MHIPPLHKRTTWQRFFIGVAVGAFLAYLILLFMYGTMYEKTIQNNSELQSTNNELKKYNDALIEDQEEAEEREDQPYKIDQITIDITNEKELMLDRLATHQLEELVMEEIDLIIGKSVQSVAENNALLIATIENKSFKVDDASYTFEVTQFILYSTVNVTLKASLET